jgi:small subunit ribosomal protein S20
MDAPRTHAIITSRARPVTLLARVARLTTATDRVMAPWSAFVVLLDISAQFRYKMVFSGTIQEEDEVANHPSALKRMRQNERRRARNRVMRSMAKTQVKRLLRAVEEKKVDEAQEALRLSTAILQKSASKGVYHRNKASRQISRLARKINALSL